LAFLGFLFAAGSFHRALQSSDRMGANEKPTIESEKPPSSPDTASDIPEPLKQFEGKTARELFLGNGATSQQADGMGGLVYGFIGEFGIPIPDFAKQASKQFWKNYLGKDFNPQENIKDAGAVSRLLELMGGDCNVKPESKLAKKVLSAAIPMAGFLEKEARALSAVETAKFYAGRARAEKVWEKIKNPDYLKMIKRAPLYLVLAVAWREFEKFKSQAEAERWLRDQKVIGENFDSSEVRAVFRLIGLRYGSKRGRPKKTKTGESISTKTGF
jgi:hypothetical protein